MSAFINMLPNFSNPSGAYSVLIGNNIDLVITVTHNLNSQNVVVALWDMSGADPVWATLDADLIESVDANTIKITFADIPAVDAYRVVIISRGGGGGDGDMLKAVYDTDDDGIVNAADSVPWSGVTGKPNMQALFTLEGVLTVGAKAIRIQNCLGRTLTISGVYLIVETAPTGANLIVDIHKDGTTIFTTQSNRPVIIAGNTTGNSTTVEVATWANGSYLTLEIDLVGSTIPGSNLTVAIVYV